jgi:LysM domain
MSARRSVGELVPFGEGQSEAIEIFQIGCGVEFRPSVKGIFDILIRVKRRNVFMPIEKHPTTPLAHNFRPAGGTPYRVRNGDTWISLAAKARIDVWNLIDYNFHTRNPDEVNWYLRRNVGCRKATPDGKNYIFSSDANPGVVYLPPPFGAPVNYTVPGIFDIIAQPLNMACWATAATMMLSWRDRQSYPINTALTMCGSRWG